MHLLKRCILASMVLYCKLVGGVFEAPYAPRLNDLNLDGSLYLRLQLGRFHWDALGFADVSIYHVLEKRPYGPETSVLRIAPFYTGILAGGRGVIWYRPGGGSTVFKKGTGRVDLSGVPVLEELMQWIEGKPKQILVAAGALFVEGVDGRSAIVQDDYILFYDRGSLRGVLTSLGAFLSVKSRGFDVEEISSGAVSLAFVVRDNDGRIEQVQLPRNALRLKYSDVGHLVRVDDEKKTLDWQFEYDGNKLLEAVYSKGEVVSDFEWVRVRSVFYPEDGSVTALARSGMNFYEWTRRSGYTQLIRTNGEYSEELLVYHGDGYIKDIQTQPRRWPWAYFRDVRRFWIGR